TLLQGQPTVRPAGVVEGVDAVELDPAVVDQVGDRPDHAVALVVPRPTLLAREHDHRAPVVAVAEDGTGAVEPGGVELELLAVHPPSLSDLSSHTCWVASRRQSPE